MSRPPERAERDVAGSAQIIASASEIATEVARLAREIDRDHPDGAVLVPVLKGSLIFASDLIRSLTVEAVVDFLAISAYEPGSGRVRLVKDLDIDIRDRPVVLVEDIVDTGLTLAFLLGELGRRQPRSLRVCTLLDRPARRIVPAELDYVGFEIPDVYVIGYGLDFAGRYRNLDVVARADAEALRADPDRYVSQLYGI